MDIRLNMYRSRVRNHLHWSLRLSFGWKCASQGHTLRQGLRVTWSDRSPTGPQQQSLMLLLAKQNPNCIEDKGRSSPDSTDQQQWSWLILKRHFWADQSWKNARCMRMRAFVHSTGWRKFPAPSLNSDRWIFLLESIAERYRKATLLRLESWSFDFLQVLVLILMSTEWIGFIFQPSHHATGKIRTGPFHDEGDHTIRW